MISENYMYERSTEMSLTGLQDGILAGIYMIFSAVFWVQKPSLSLLSYHPCMELRIAAREQLRIGRGKCVKVKMSESKMSEKEEWHMEMEEIISSLLMLCVSRWKTVDGSSGKTGQTMGWGIGPTLTLHGGQGHFHGLASLQSDEHYGFFCIVCLYCGHLSCDVLNSEGDCDFMGISSIK